MRERVPGKTLGDYVTIAFSPILIMTLVGSLVFFLLEVCYAGQYSSRLQWTLFWFVLAMVLIARIGIEQADGRAGMYGLAMGAAVFVSLQAFIEYPPGAPIASFRWAINLGLLALVWWCANRLVWDCTYIDDSVDDAGAGLLDAAGLDAQSSEVDEDDDDEEPEPKKGKKSPRQPKGVSGWLDRYRLYRDKKKNRPHAAGVWVVYFSLAALPLFGLGQALIPAVDADRRRYAFWLMVIYVASGLGLLLTTSYLGLRRYLRQRKLSVPFSMTAAWLALGAILIVSMLVIGALLPRPYGEYQLVSFKPLGAPEREASKYAVKNDGGAGKGEGRASSDPKANDPQAKDGQGTQRSDKSSATTKGGKSQGSGKGGQKGGSSKGGKGGSKSGKSNSSNDKNRDDSNKDNKDQDDSKNSDDEQKDQNRDPKDGPNTKTDSRGNKSEGKGSKETDQKGNKDNQDKTDGDKQSEPPPSSFQFLEKLGWLGTLLKWVVFGIIAAVVIFFILRSGLRWLANFTLWARNLLNALSAWWNGLFGGGSGGGGSGSDEEAEEAIRPPRPFSSYSNPFRDGTANHSPPEEIARYTFAAFEAWGYDHDLGRSPQETPLEFFERVAQRAPDLTSDGKRMLGCYVRVAYARSRLTPAALEALEKFWNSLESADVSDLATKGAREGEMGS
ncbi:DUF4129 domain-containing protein [soil metagenome]